MTTPNVRTLKVLGGLVALNAGLFVFNNLPLIQVQEQHLAPPFSQEVHGAARDARQFAREARMEARIAQKQARFAADRVRVEVGKHQGRQKPDQLACLGQFESLDKLNLSIDLPPMPPVVDLPPELRSLPLGPISHSGSRRITLQQYFRDRVL